MRILVGFECTECKNKNYTTSKNKQKNTEKLRKRKFCKCCKKHVEHKEVKV